MERPDAEATDPNKEEYDPYYLKDEAPLIPLTEEYKHLVTYEDKKKVDAIDSDHHTELPIKRFKNTPLPPIKLDSSNIINSAKSEAIDPT